MGFDSSAARLKEVERTPDLTKAASPAVKEAVRLYRELKKLEKTADRTAIDLASKLSMMDTADVLDYARITSAEDGK